MPSISFVDTETLGLDPDDHAIWEVGLVKYDSHSGRTIPCSWQIRLTDLQVAAGDPVGMEIGRFGERYDPTRATDPREFCEEFVALTRDSHLAGNVISFDEERLRRLCATHGVKHAWHYHLIDIEPMIVGYLRGRGQWAPGLPWNSTELSAAIGVDKANYDAHTALGDATWALDEYRAMHS